MKCRVAVSFEFESSPPLTWSGDITAINDQMVASRAVREAKKMYKNRKWSSMTVCVLEQLSEAGNSTLKKKSVC